MPSKIDLQQHRNYRFQWKFLWRILFYALILAGILYFINSLETQKKPSSRYKGIEVEVIPSEP